MFTMKLNKINWLLAFNLFVVFAVSSVVSPRAEACPAFTTAFWECVGESIYKEAIEPIIGPVINEFKGVTSMVSDYIGDPRHSFTIAAVQDVSEKLASNALSLLQEPANTYEGELADFIYRRDFQTGRSIRFSELLIDEMFNLSKAAAAQASTAGNEELAISLGGAHNLFDSILADQTGFSLREFLTEKSDEVQEGIGNLDDYLQDAVNGVTHAVGADSRAQSAQPTGLDTTAKMDMVTDQTNVKFLNARAESIAGDTALLMITDELQAKGDAAQKASEERDLALASDINTNSENSLLRDRLLDFRVNQANVRIDDSNLRIAETNLRLDDTVLRLDNLSKRVDYNSRKASSGIASALAASTALAGSGNNSIGAGIGSWGGEQAISVSIKKSVNDKASISSSVSHTRFGTALSAGWNFNF